MTTTGLPRPLDRDAGNRRAHIAVAAIVTAVVALYCWHRLGRGWVPHDEGTIAQSAERVLRHEVPHHDFIDVYTGGLSYLNAWAMQVFGQSLRAPREVLFILFLGWVPLFYYCIAKFVSPFAAGGLTLLAVMWSFPMYPAALPSWYILFLATLGIAALLRYIDDRHAGWLVLAGVAGGFAMLVKVSGLFIVAAVLLFLAYLEQSQTALRAPDPAAGRGRAWLAVLVTGLLLLVAALIMLVRHKWSAGMALHFVLPSAALGAMMLVTEWRLPPAPFRSRLLGGLRTCLPFLAGVVLPLGLFALPYAGRGQLGELLNGVFVLPGRRVYFAAIRPPGPTTLLAALPLAALLVPWSPLSRRRLAVNLALLAGGLLAVFVVSGTSPWLYGRTWLSVRSLGPVAVLAGAFMLAREDTARPQHGVLRQRQALVLWVLALLSLLQFPFAAPIYYCYVAPIVVLAIVALRPIHPTVPRSVTAVVVCFYIAFAVWRVHPGSVFSYGVYYEADRQTEPLRLARAGLTVTRDDQSTYERLIPLVEAHAQNGVVLALPDAPEVSFLAGRANPTRALFEFFDEPMTVDSLLALARARGVTAVVVNGRPSFSKVLSPETLAALRSRYPSEEQVGQFLVLWQTLPHRAPAR